MLGALGSNFPVIAGQNNRTPEPKESDFIVMWPILRNRISTNIDDSVDTSFTGFIVATQLLVNEVLFGEIKIGQTIYGIDVAADTTIIDFVTGTGGPGIYTVDVDQTAAGPNFYSGQTIIMQPTEVVMQLDVHGPASADNAQIISTLFRDVYATDQFALIDSNITPLFAENPRQIPFVNAEQQYENRWIIEIHLEANQSVIFPQQFADAVAVDLINVEATYP